MNLCKDIFSAKRPKPSCSLDPVGGVPPIPKMLYFHKVVKEPDAQGGVGEPDVP